MSNIHIMHAIYTYPDSEHYRMMVSKWKLLHVQIKAVLIMVYSDLIHTKGARYEYTSLDTKLRLACREPMRRRSYAVDILEDKYIYILRQQRPLYASLPTYISFIIENTYIKE